MFRNIFKQKILLQRCVGGSPHLLHPAASFVNPSCHPQQRNFTQDFWASISNSTAVTTMQEGIIRLHDTSGLPWWSTIIVSTVLLRGLITFPLSLYQHKILAKVERLTTEMPELVKELKAETNRAVQKFGWTEQQARIMYNRSLKQQWNKMIVRDNCHPMKASVVIIFQIPLWVIQSWALRNLIYMQPDPSSLTAQMVFTEMTVGGFGFIPNLTEVDHSLILPVTLGLLNLTIIEIQKMSRKVQVNSKFQTYLTNFFRLFSIAMIPIAASVPSGLCLYWVSSSAFGLAQNFMLLSPKLRRLAFIPKVNSEVDKPYRFILDKLKERIGK